MTPTKPKTIVNPDGSIKVIKSYVAITEENVSLAKRLDYITKEEVMEAIGMIANELGLDIKFTYNSMKKKL